MAKENLQPSFDAVAELDRKWKEREKKWKAKSTSYVNEEYLEKLNNPDKPPRAVSFKEATDMWFEIANRKAHRTTKMDFHLSDENRAVIRKVWKVLINESDKGVALVGNYGSGKSLLMEIFSEFLQKFENLPSFKIVNAHDVVSEFSISGDVGLKIFDNRHWCFDDLGTEELGVHFGQKEEIFRKILEKRYIRFNNEGLKTHFTTNLDKPELVKRYGQRLSGRLDQMVEFIYLGKTADSVDYRRFKK